jgi:hypothetical protein
VADEDRVRVEVAFDGGQIMGALVSVESADALDQALAAGADGSFVLDAHDGAYTVAVPRIVYVKRFRGGGRVGFGAT